MKTQQHNTNGSESRVKRVDSRFLAEKYNVSTRQILLLAARKAIPSFRVGTKAIRFDEAAVATALEGPTEE